MAVKYEFHPHSNLPGVEQLWREETEWGENSVEDFRRWFERSPFGKTHIVIAADTETGEMLGHSCYIPTRVLVNGRETRAVRSFATIVTQKMRDSVVINSQLDLPVVAMYACAARAMKAMGEQLIYMLPDPRMSKYLENTGVLLNGSFPLWSLPVPLEQPINLDDSYRVVPFEWSDERVNQLWKKSSGLYGCSIVRNAEALRWKFSNAKYTLTAVEKNGELVGLVASRNKGDRQWLICDILCADAGDSMRAALIATCNAAQENYLAEQSERAILKISVLTTSLLEPIVRGQGFPRDAYDFPFAAHILDQSISAEDASPAQWYLSAND